MVNRIGEPLRHSVYAHLFAGLVVAFELNHAGDLREKRIIATLAHISARMDPSPALTHDNRTRINRLSIIPLDAEELGTAVSSIS